MAENNQVQISVALCTYNGEAFIEEQLDSILYQSLPVDEIIICDDQSTDNTITIIENYIQLHPKIIRLYQNTTKHFTIKNFERAISLTTGDYIFLSDQDDIWVPHKVKRCIDYFKSNTTCLMLFTNASLVDAKTEKIEGDLWNKWDFNSDLQMKWLNPEFQITSLIQNINKVTGATVAIKSNLKKDVIPMNLPKGIWHDCFMALHAAKYKGLNFMDEKLIQYRIHENQQVGLGGDNSSNNDAVISHKEYRAYLKLDFKDYLKYFDARFFSSEKYLKKNNIKLTLISFFKFIRK